MPAIVLLAMVALSRELYSVTRLDIRAIVVLVSKESQRASYTEDWVALSASASFDSDSWVDCSLGFFSLSLTLMKKF